MALTPEPSGKLIQCNGTGTVWLSLTIRTTVTITEALTDKIGAL